MKGLDKEGDGIERYKRRVKVEGRCRYRQKRKTTNAEPN